MDMEREREMEMEMVIFGALKTKLGGDFWSPEGQLRAHICIKEALDIRF